MISSQPSGGDEPPRRRESGSLDKRDNPARSHTVPYDRPDRPDRYDRPRPARRDSRAGPEIKERDWRRSSRPSNPYVPPSSAAQHPLNRRDDRASRDRAARDRRRLERPRERPDRPERVEGSDRLDRRSSWQHTSAPYVREPQARDPGAPAANGNGHAHPKPRRPDSVSHDDYRVTKTARPEPKFARRPGDSFWDLMTGQPQSSNKERLTVRPNGAASRHAEHHHSAPHDEGHDLPRSGTSSGSWSGSTGVVSRSISPLEKADSSPAPVVPGPADRAPGSPKYEPSPVAAADKPSVALATADSPNLAPEPADLKPADADPAVNDASEMEVDSEAPAADEPVADSKDHDEKALDSTEPTVRTQPEGSDEPDVPAEPVQLETAQTPLDRKPIGDAESSDEKDPVAAKATRKEERPTETLTSQPVSPSLHAPTVDGSVEPLAPTRSHIEGIEDATFTSMPKAEPASELQPSVGAGDDSDAEITKAAIGEYNGDTEMVDASAPNDEPAEETLDSHVEPKQKPGTLTVEFVTAPVPKPSEDGDLNVPVPTPQDLKLRSYLVSEYEALSVTVAPAVAKSKKWTLSAPDPRVSAALIAQQFDLKRDIRQRQVEFLTQKCAWLKSCDLLDEESAARSTKAPEAPSKPEAHASGHAHRRSKDVDPDLHRRSRERSRAHGDVARSEAEFLEILANLEAETALDPLVRARQTSARIPQQRQDLNQIRFQSRDDLVVNHADLLKRLQTDAVDTFSPEEHEVFLEAYTKFPKEFGKIAEMVGRDFNQCVMHYYRTKKAVDYKKAVQRRRKSKRGRKPKKKGAEDDSPATPNLTGDSQFESPKEVIEIVSPASNDAVLFTPQVVLPYPANVPALQPVQPSPVVQTAPAVQPAYDAQPTGQPTGEVQLASAAVQSDTTAGLEQQHSEAHALVPQQGLTSFSKSQIPPPVLPLVQSIDQPSTISHDLKWTPLDISRLESLFAEYGSRLDEIALQLNRPAESVKEFYEKNHHKYLAIIQKADSANYRSKLHAAANGPSAGFFPPRNKPLPIAKSTTGAQTSTEPADSLEPPQPQLPPVVQPSHGTVLLSQSIPPAVVPQESAGAHPKLSSQPRQTLGGKQLATAQEKSMAPILNLNLGPLPILPCLPDPSKLAKPINMHAHERFQRFRESYERTH